MTNPLHDSLKQLVQLQREQIQQSQRANNDQKQQFSQLSRALHQTTTSSLSSSDESGFIDTTRRLSRYQAQSFDREMRRVIIDLGKQWQQFGRDGKINIEQLGRSLLRILQKIISQSAISSSLVAHSSLGSGIQAVLGGIFHQGGMVSDHAANIPLSANLFRHSQRLHQGGKLGLGIGPAEYPAILQRGETVLPASSATAMAVMPKVEVNIHRAPTEARTTYQQKADGSIEIDIIFDHFEAHIGQRLSRGEGLATAMENRYSLNPTPLS